MWNRLFTIVGFHKFALRGTITIIEIEIIIITRFGLNFDSYGYI